MHILIAEDEALTRCALESKFKRWGYDVVAAADGKEAWECLRQADGPQLALLDWSMPHMSGIEVTRKIRRQDGSRYVYVILLTGKTRTEDIVAGMEAGADDYVFKPFKSEELKARLQSAERVLDLHTRIAEEHHAREAAQQQLHDARRLEAVGQLAAGIAHEINTPLQYTGDNTRFLQESFQDIRGALEAYGQMLSALKGGTVSPDLVERVEKTLDQADVPYLLEEMPQAITQSLEGIDRVTKIVRAMKDFSHPGVKDKAAIDINRAIESTTTVCRNEWKYVAEMELALDRALPPVLCLPGELNQVILNLVINAAHAIAAAGGQPQADQAKGVIAVSTQLTGDWVEVRVRDTGTGIPEEVRPRIFDPFFTTKDVGEGTGQGLTIAHSVVVDKHGGTIDFETETGVGTTFIVRLPLEGVKMGDAPLFSRGTPPNGQHANN